MTNEDWSDERSAEHRRRARLNHRTPPASRTWVASTVASLVDWTATWPPNLVRPVVRRHKHPGIRAESGHWLVLDQPAGRDCSGGPAVSYAAVGGRRPSGGVACRRLNLPYWFARTPASSMGEKISRQGVASAPSCPDWPGRRRPCCRCGR